MDDYISGLLFIGLLGLSAFFSATETAFFALSPLRLKKLESEGDEKATEILKVLGNKQKMLMTLLLGNTMVNVVATAMATKILIDYLPKSPIAEFVGGSVSMGVAIASFLMTVILLVFGEITPKTIAIYGAYGYSRFAVKPLRLAIFLFTPFTALLMLIISKVFPKYSDWNNHLGSSTTMDEIDSYFTLGEEAGIIERDEKEMISSVFEFGDTLVREVMVPRPDIISMPINIGFEDLLRFIREDGHSRFPVYDGSLDRVVGILYVKDILMKLDDIRASYDLFKLLRAPFFVPETKKLDDLLSEFQKRKQHMALVVDEYGGISGLVTIEDLLEEIVGEIVDEYDLEEQAPLTRLEENVYSVDARYSISDFEEELGLKLDYEDSETVGGFVLEKLGRIPQKGEVFTEPQGTFTVTEIKGNRILRVRFNKNADYVGDNI
ncbi:MAG: hemolysin family protein [Candidatus Rifleibacteriota bacterium]